jgi:hypothetical protein
MCEISFINRFTSESFVAFIIMKITNYESDINLLAISTGNFSLTQILVPLYLKYTKVNSVKFPQILKVRSVHFSEPNLAAQCTRLQFTKPLQLVEQEFQRVVTLLLNVKGKFQF